MMRHDFRVGQVVKPRMDNPLDDGLQGVVQEVKEDSLVIKMITGSVVVKAKRHILPLDIEGPVFVHASFFRTAYEIF